MRNRRGRINESNPVNWAHPLNKGLTAWWLALSGSGKGGTFRDLLGRNPGTLTNGPTWASGYGGFGAVSFDGTNDVVLCGSTLPTANLAALTVEAVAYTATQTSSGGGGGLRYLASAENTGAGANWCLRYAPGSGYLEFFVGNSSGAESTHATDTINPAVGTWYHWVGVYTGSRVLLYRDGVVRADVASVLTSTGTNNRQFTIGAGDPDSGRAWSGGIQSVAYWPGVALSADSVAARYDQWRRGFPDVLARVPRRVVSVAAAAPAGNRRRRVLMGASR